MADPVQIGTVYETYGLRGYPTDKARYVVATGAAMDGRVWMTTFTSDVGGNLGPGQAIPLAYADYRAAFRSPANRGGLPPRPQTNLNLINYRTGDNTHFEATVAASFDIIYVVDADQQDEYEVKIGQRVGFRFREDDWHRIEQQCPITHTHLFSCYHTAV